jgi:hypothetical protein
MVIARYRLWLIWARMVFLALFLFVFLPWFTIWAWHQMQVRPGPHFAEGYRLGAAWLFAIVGIPQLLDVFRQVVWHGDRLVWIENGQLIYRYLSRSVTVPCSDIVRVSTWVDGFFNQYDTITLHLRDGSEKVIRSDQFSEDADDIAQRLREALGHKNNPSMTSA